MPQEGGERESFTIISDDSLFIYKNKYYPQVYLGNCAYKTVNIEIVYHLDGDLF